MFEICRKSIINLRKNATVQIVVKAKVFAMSHKKKKENENIDIGENSCEDMSEDEGSNPDIYKGNEVS